MSYAYKRMVEFIRQDPDDRHREGLLMIEDWFRKKSKLLNTLKQETLLDVIKHCDFVTKQRDDVIIHQGQKGHRFYIMLRGSVSVLHKEALEDVDLGDEGSNSNVTRESLGQHLTTLGEGATFGEIALINPDCIRTASVVSDEQTDLVVIHRDLYNRSVSKVLAREYEEKMNFIDSMPLLSAWQPKFRKQLTACFKKETLPFDGVLVKQGDPATNMYFIISGELKITVDPEGHFHQFDRFMDKCSTQMNGTRNGTITSDEAYFPQKILPQLKKLSRVSRTSQLQRPAVDGSDSESANEMSSHITQTWSPSAVRKINAQIHSRRVNLGLSYIGEKQCIGEAEFLLQLDTHHVTATCSQETSVFSLSRSHFDRVFRRRNPTSLQNMARTAELIISRRMVKPNITESVPLLKCLIFKLQEMVGEKRPANPDSDDGSKFIVPDMYFVDKSQSRSEAVGHKTYFWSAGIKDVRRTCEDDGSKLIPPPTNNNSGKSENPSQGSSKERSKGRKHRQDYATRNYST